MQDVIADILDEKFCYEAGNIEFSCPKLTLRAKKGKTADGTFAIRANGPVPMEASVFCTDLRMRCDVEFLEGYEKEIHCRFTAKGMEAGETAEGKFQVISRQGEYELPFTVTVENDFADSSMGEMKNMFQFANLAKTNWEEAVQMFYTPQFANVFLGNDRQYFGLYQGLSCLPKNAQNVEEFLIAANKKQRVEYTLAETRIQMYDPSGIVSGEIELIRSGWGYTALTLQAEDAFLSLEKTSLNDDDFLGNRCRTAFYVNSAKLHAGRNFGTIRIESPYHALQVQVMVINTPKKRFAIGIRREQKQLISELMALYLSFRMKKTAAIVWMKETSEILNRLCALDEKDAAARLLMAQLFITKERYGEAQWMLEKTLPLLPGDGRGQELDCYYLYLMALCAKSASSAKEAAQTVRKAHRMEPSNFRIAWLLLYLEEDYNKSPAKKWMFLEEQFGRGSRSPLLYVEAVSLLNANPAFLLQLSDYTVSLLRFGCRYDALSGEIVSQVCYLADKQKEFKQNIYSLLTECYQMYQEEEVLQSVCIMLVKGDKTGEAYAPWYEKAVEADLRITRLYEHYMASLPLEYEGRLARMMLMYFAYNNNLNVEKKAYLYAYIVKNSEDYPDLYRTYIPEIERFVAEQVQKGRISRHLAYLYQKILTPQMVQGNNAAALADILFTEYIASDHPGMTHVVVVYDKLKAPCIYPLMGGKAYVPIYSGGHTVFLEDLRGSRYVKSINFVREKLLAPGRLAKLAAPFAGAHTGLDLYFCENGGNALIINEDNAAHVQNLMDCAQIRDSYKDETMVLLVEFYYESDRIRDLDRSLMLLRPDKLTMAQRGLVIRYLTVRGMYDMAVAWMKEYGTDGVEPKTIVRLSRRLLEREPDFYDAGLTKIMHRAFVQRKYDETMLWYLSRYFKGTIEEMRDLWNACDSYDVDVYALSERMLGQMLFTGVFVDEKMQVFAAYLRGGAKTEVAYAFLTRACYDYFVMDGKPQKQVFAELTRIFCQGERLNMVSRLAFLKYFAAQKEPLTQGVSIVAERFLEELIRDGVCFSFFRAYADKIPAMARVADRIYIEHRAAPETKVMLHYGIQREDGEEAAYKTEQMKNMYGGIFVKALVLFYGECLRYAVTREEAGEEHVAESRTIFQNDGSGATEGGRFACINDIALAAAVQDYDTAQAMLQDYFVLDGKVKALFGPL